MSRFFILIPQKEAYFLVYLFYIILWVLLRKGQVLGGLSGRPLLGNYFFEFLDSNAPPPLGERQRPAIKGAIILRFVQANRVNMRIHIRRRG